MRLAKPRTAYLLAFALGLGPAGLVAAAIDDPKPADEPTSVAERYKALEAEYEAKRGAWSKEYYRDKPQTNQEHEEASKRASKLHPDEADYARRSFALYEEDRDGPVAPDALYFTFQLLGHPGHYVDVAAVKPETWARAHDQYERCQRIIEILRDRFAADPRMANYCQQIGLTLGRHQESLMRAILDRNPDRAAKGQAAQALAGILGGNGSFARALREGKSSDAMTQYLKICGDDWRDWLATRDADALLAEAEALHRRVVDEYADVRLFPAYPEDERTIGAGSESWLANKYTLIAGKPAPAIEGTTLDGRPMRLGDYRGKVVALVFWASWCGPCMEEVPHEKELHERLKDDPDFVLLGVNCDHEVEAAHRIVEKMRIPWRNWYDGDKSDRTIVESYHIQGIPALFVIGPDGVIRARDVRGEKLDAAVAAALAELEQSRKAADADGKGAP